MSSKTKIYSYFINEAVLSKILTRLIFYERKESDESTRKLEKHIEIDDQSPDSNDECSEIFNTPTSKISRGGFLYNRNPYSFPRIKPKITARLKASEDSSSRNSNSRVTTPASRNRMFMYKKSVLLAENTKIRELFDEISKNKQKINHEDFKSFLMIRYPELVAESMSKYFNIKQLTCEEYITEMNKFINSGEIKHLEFCFQIFDFNKDEFICLKDAYTALEIRTNNFYDSDIAAIIDMFNLKKEGKIPVDKRFRRKSTFGLIKDKRTKLTKEIKKNIIKPKKNDSIAIKFKEFCKVRFNERPQIFLDFLFYACNYNFLKEKGFIIPSPIHSAKNSETIVVQMNLNAEYHDSLRKKEKYEYYCELNSVMNLFTKGE